MSVRLVPLYRYLDPDIAMLPHKQTSEIATLAAQAIQRVTSVRGM